MVLKIMKLILQRELTVAVLRLPFSSAIVKISGIWSVNLKVTSTCHFLQFNKDIHYVGEFENIN